MITLELADNTARARLHPEASPLAPSLQISVLGPLMIRRGGIELGANDLGGPKPRQVLEILLMNFGSAVSKTRIIDLLWGGNHPAVALRTLESYVSVLRRHLQPGTGRTGALRTVTGGYAIDRSLVDLDLDRFETLTKAAGQAEPREALALLTEALELASAPLLGDELLPSWAEEERAAHAARVGLARVMAAETALTVGETGRAIHWAGVAVKEDPLNERAWTALILGLEQNGENTEALRAFDRCRRVMDQELGCTPGPALREAQARLLRSTAATSLPPGPVGPVQVVTESRPVTGATTQETGRLRILIVDDYITFSDLLARVVNREPDPQSLEAAKAVASAVTMLRDLGPDVVMMDLYFPDGSALEAAERILSEAPGTRVVMLGATVPGGPARGRPHGHLQILPQRRRPGSHTETPCGPPASNVIVNPSLVARWGSTVPAEPESLGK